MKNIEQSSGVPGSNVEGYDTTYAYNAGGQLETVTDPNGAVTTNGYSNSARVNNIVNALGH